MKIELEVNGCNECPYCVSGNSYGNDGRDGWTVYICKQGAYGNFSSGLFEGYASGLESKPTVIHSKCPLK